MRAYIFPGQGAQFTGMGLALYENSTEAQELFEKANKILGFAITDYFIGFHSLLIWTWGSLSLVGLISKFSRGTITRLFLAFLGAFIFFIFSNFGGDDFIFLAISSVTSKDFW